jgi:hypothetical protein
MAKILAYCGLDCGECEAYLATQKNDRDELEKIAKKWAEAYGAKDCSADMCVCDGCPEGKRLSTAHAISCGIRLCASSRQVPTCAHCEAYICDTLRQFIQFAPVLGEKLEKIRKELGK